MLAAACEEENGSDGDPTAQLTPLTTDEAPTEEPDLNETPEATEGASGGGAPSSTDV